MSSLRRLRLNPATPTGARRTAVTALVELPTGQTSQPEEPELRKITAGLFVTLDGVVEDPQNWQFPYYNEQIGMDVAAQIAACDTMLFGRRTYEEFAAHWSKLGSDAPFADAINGSPKIVASSTLRSLDWQNSTLLGGDLMGDLSALKGQAGKNISVSGSPTLVRSLLELGLLDELHLMIHPIVLGRGKRLFSDKSGVSRLKLQSCERYDTGVLSAVYVPDVP